MNAMAHQQHTWGMSSGKMSKGGALDRDHFEAFFIFIMSLLLKDPLQRTPPLERRKRTGDHEYSLV